MSKKYVYLVSPGGFCAGVRCALEIFENTRKMFSGTIYVLHELVHNHRVGEQMRRQGAVFVNDLSEIPPESVVLFGAHGVGRKEETEIPRNPSVLRSKILRRTDFSVNRGENTANTSVLASILT